MRLIRYTRVNLHMPLILRYDSLSVITWSVYAPFATHLYYKGKTGAMILMVLGPIMKISQKQIINGRISTKAKMVGSDNALPQCLWSIYFIEGQ